MRIAQRFIAGNQAEARPPPAPARGRSPRAGAGGGRDEPVGPTVETVGYSRASLRDGLIAEVKR